MFRTIAPRQPFSYTPDYTTNIYQDSGVSTTYPRHTRHTGSIRGQSVVSAMRAIGGTLAGRRISRRTTFAAEQTLIRRPPHHGLTKPVSRLGGCLIGAFFREGAP